jgi:hypothetical protein
MKLDLDPDGMKVSMDLLRKAIRKAIRNTLLQKAERQLKGDGTCDQSN